MVGVGVAEQEGVDAGEVRQSAAARRRCRCRRRARAWRRRARGEAGARIAGGGVAAGAAQDSQTHGRDLPPRSISRRPAILTTARLPESGTRPLAFLMHRGLGRVAAQQRSRYSPERGTPCRTGAQRSIGTKGRSPAATPSWSGGASGACWRRACSPNISTRSPSSSATSLPENGDYRPGVPQARHLHFLLKRGLMVVEELFPGITADLLEKGSHLLDQGRDFRILYRFGLVAAQGARPRSLHLHPAAARGDDPPAPAGQSPGQAPARASRSPAWCSARTAPRVEGVTLYPRHHDPQRPRP